MGSIKIPKNYYFYFKDREPQALYVITAMTKSEAIEKIDKIHTENGCEGFKTAERMKLIYNGYNEKELAEKIDKKVKGVWNHQISIANLNIYKAENKNDCIYLIDTNGQPTQPDYSSHIEFLRRQIKTINFLCVRATHPETIKEWQELLAECEVDLAKYTELQNGNI